MTRSQIISNLPDKQKGERVHVHTTTRVKRRVNGDPSEMINDPSMVT